MSFSAHIEHINKVVVVKLKGRLMEIDEQNNLIDSIKSEIEQGNHSVVLNLGELEYMNSSGINSFISILTKTRNNGGDTVICCLPKKIEQLLIITKLNSVFTIAASEEEAVSKLSENINA
jgi:anti-sigma B factor antagonist